MMEELTLVRKWLLPICTIGTLHNNNGQKLCYILEDKVRASKIPKQTAIPDGRYQIVRTMSQRFGVMMPLLLGVPKFDGVRIHWGNTTEDTEGCLITGSGVMVEQSRVILSRAAYNKLDAQIAAWLKRGRLFVTITNPPGTPKWLG